MESKHLAIVIIMIVLMILSVILILVSQSISAKKDVLISQLKQRVPENVVIHKTENIIIKQDPLVKLLGLGISVILHRISTKKNNS